MVRRKLARRKRQINDKAISNPNLIANLEVCRLREASVAYVASVGPVAVVDVGFKEQTEDTYA